MKIPTDLKHCTMFEIKMNKKQKEDPKRQESEYKGKKKCMNKLIEIILNDTKRVAVEKPVMRSMTLMTPPPGLSLLVLILDSVMSTSMALLQFLC